MSWFEGVSRFSVFGLFVYCFWDDSQLTNALLFAILVEASFFKLTIKNITEFNVTERSNEEIDQ